MTNITTRAAAALSDPAASNESTGLRKRHSPMLERMRGALAAGAVVLVLGAAFTPQPAHAGLFGYAATAAIGGESAALTNLSEEARAAAQAVGSADYRNRLAILSAAMNRHKVVGKGTVTHALNSAVGHGEVPLTNAQRVAVDLGIDPSKILSGGDIANPSASQGYSAPSSDGFVPQPLIR